MFDVVTKLYAEGGIRSLFRGTVATLARDGPGSAAYFATYEYLKKMLSAAPETLPDGSKAPAPPLSVPAIMAAGGGAGIAMWSLGIPPDVSFFFLLSVSSSAINLILTHPSFFFTPQTIKSRLQSAPQGTYTGFMDCARKLIAQDGVTALWKGFGPAMARAVPANVS